MRAAHTRLMWIKSAARDACGRDAELESPATVRWHSPTSHVITYLPASRRAAHHGRVRCVAAVTAPTTTASTVPPGIAHVVGGGAARGFAHVGVVETLEPARESKTRAEFFTSEPDQGRVAA